MGCRKLSYYQAAELPELIKVSPKKELTLKNSSQKVQGAYLYGFNGKERDDEVSGSGNQYDYGFRIYNPRLGKFLSVDPLTASYPMLTPYQFASNMPIAAIDKDGLEAYIVVFPDYKISTPLGKIGGLGHGGSLIINPTSGEAYYMEYGRYDSKKGNARVIGGSHQIGTVEFDENGTPTEQSLARVMGVISKKAGHGGRIEAAEFKVNEQEFFEMLGQQKQLLNESNNPNREPYVLNGKDANNCGTVACDVVKDNLGNSGIPESVNARPVKMIQEVLNGNENATRVGYDPNNNSVTRGGEYVPSEDEEKTDKRIKDGG